MGCCRRSGRAEKGHSRRKRVKEKRDATKFFVAPALPPEGSEERSLMDMQEWGRLITAMATPFDAALDVDYAEAAAFAKKLVAEGSSALVIGGTTGEAPTLSEEEKCRLFRAVKEAVSVPVIAGIGTNCTRSTVAMGKKAAECGVDGVLVVVPYYNKPPQQSLYEHFKVVAEEVKLPVMLYNVPGRTSCNLASDTAAALSRVPGIVALKEASGDLEQTTRVLRDARKGFSVYTGDDPLTIPTLAVGGYGVVSVAAMIAGPRMKRMIDAFCAGNVAEAAAIHQELAELIKALFVTTNPIPVKAALTLLGVPVGGHRLPLTGATPEVVETLRAALGKLGLL